MTVRCPITVVILTHNEEIHIERCLASLLPVVEAVCIIDSGSSDKTVERAQKMGAVVLQHPWKNYADQFQWGLNNAPIDTEWVMRMDADEYLEPALQQEIQMRLPNICANVSGIYLKRKVMFMGRWIRYGGFYPHILLRIWRVGTGRIEQRWMDEHIILDEGETIQFDQDLVDDNLKGISFWVDKHNGYASREMVDLLNRSYDLLPKDDAIKTQDDPQARWKRLMKDEVYSRIPPGLRATLYFIYRYFFRLGFLDGRQGFIFHFMQGFWYRLLVDVKVMEVLDKSDGDIEKMRNIIRSEYNLKL